MLTKNPFFFLSFNSSTLSGLGSFPFIFFFGKTSQWVRRVRAFHLWMWSGSGFNVPSCRVFREFICAIMEVGSLVEIDGAFDDSQQATPADCPRVDVCYKIDIAPFAESQHIVESPVEAPFNPFKKQRHNQTQGEEGNPPTEPTTDVEGGCVTQPFTSVPAAPSTPKPDDALADDRSNSDARSSQAATATTEGRLKTSSHGRMGPLRAGRTITTYKWMTQEQWKATMREAESWSEERLERVWHTMITRRPTDICDEAGGPLCLVNVGTTWEDE